MKLQVWNVINPPNKSSRHNVATITEALTLINTMAQIQLMNPRITSNAFGLEAYDEKEQEWSEWYDEEGNDIDAYHLVNGVAILIENY